MRAGVCHLIHAQATAGIKFEAKELQQMYRTLQENLMHPVAEIQEAATKALESFCRAYFSKNKPASADEDTFKWMVKEIQKLFTPSGEDENLAATRGYNMGFGSLSFDLLEELNVELIDTLMRNCVSKGREQDDAETRKQTVKSLMAVLERLTLSKVDISQFVDVIETLFKAMNDYAVDRRGDVGSWVRDQAMQALTRLVALVLEPTMIEEHKHARKALAIDENPAFLERYVGALLQQLMEKIDAVREVAGRQLQ